MHLYLIRHAVTAETGTVLSGRMPDIHLSEQGRTMATDAAQALQGLRPATVLTSPIERCRETAAILAGGWNARPKIDRSFIEADYGTWSGRKLASLYKLKAWGELMVSPSRFRFPEGETLLEVQRRAVAGCERLAGTHRRDDTVVVVSHADVIRTVLVHYLGMPLDLVHRIHVRPSSRSLIELAPGGPPQVPIVNEVGQ